MANSQSCNELPSCFFRPYSLAPGGSARASFGFVVLTRSLTVLGSRFREGLLFDSEFSDIVASLLGPHDPEAGHLSVVELGDLQLGYPNQDDVNDHHDENIDKYSQCVIWSFDDAADAQEGHDASHADAKHDADDGQHHFEFLDFLARYARPRLNHLYFNARLADLTRDFVNVALQVIQALAMAAQTINFVSQRGDPLPKAVLMDEANFANARTRKLDELALLL